jgi:hypothetical protein
MNVSASLISAGLGAAFFAAASALYYQPDLINPDSVLDMIVTRTESKARAAVLRLLINPASAEFSVSRSVQVDAAKYVCGEVNAKDKSGYYAGYHAFVYTAAIDFAYIDDDGRIAQKHAGFKPCPVSEEEKQKMLQSPGALSMLKNIQKIAPAGDPSTLSAMASQMSPGGGRPAGATLEQQVTHMSGQLVSAGQLGSRGQLGLAAQPGLAAQAGSAAQPESAEQQEANSTFTAALDNESEWRSDRPPAAWPKFPSDHPLARPGPVRTAAQAMAAAEDVERRWMHFKARDSKARPSSEEIKEALRALLAINPKHEEFAKAWAAFVRLRKIEHDAAA